MCYGGPAEAPTRVPAARPTISSGPGRGQLMIGQFVQVLVRDNNVDQALRVLKKKMQREGVFREMKARKQAIREGLIAAPKRPERPQRGGRPGMAPPPRPATV